MAEEKQYLQDVDGYNEVTKALMNMIRSYPGLDDDEKVMFNTSDPEDGLTVFATSGSFIMDDHESVTGHVWQTCLYPFTVIYRASGLNERRKVETQEWLDKLARWMTRQPVNINNHTEWLSEWPKLTGDRKIRSISRQTPVYLSTEEDSKVENWVMQLQIQYLNEFDR